MAGLLVIGTHPDAGELRVAAALVAGAPATGAVVPVATGPAASEGLALVAGALGVPAQQVCAHVFGAPASPLVAARHAGVALDPAELVASVRDAEQRRDPLVVAAGGGLLAPLTPRYAVRDLARELGLPVVLAAARGPNALPAVLLSAEGVRGAGLALAAAVLVGWPEPPTRVDLDERATLADSLGVTVVALPSAARSADELGAVARSWAVPEWLAAAGPETAPAGAAVEIVLEPYHAWPTHPVGDPRTTPRPQIMAAMLEIIAAEGPMTASRAYAVYNRAAGGRKLTSVARAPLSSSIYWLAREGKVVLVREPDAPWQGDDLVRLPDTPAVRVRALGPRALEEVPLDEVAELIRRLRTARGLRDSAALKRAVLDAYGLVRLTQRADEYLELALGLAADPGRG